MRVYIVATYPTIRAGLSALVRSQPGWDVVGEVAPVTLSAQASNTDTHTSSAKPDALHDIDVVLADLDGLAEPQTIGEWLNVLAPHGGLVAMSAIAQEGRRGPTRDIPGAQQLLREVIRATEEYGLAFGALPRDATREEVIAALTAVSSGLVALDRRLASDLLAPRERAAVAMPDAPSVSTGESLTARELEVLQLMAQGLPNKLIAARLHITEHTAKFHVSSILLKLGAASRTEAVTLAARRGLLLL